METETPAERRMLPLLLVLFVGSGCAALIYEIVWFQLLQLVIGSSAVSLGVLLGTFMGGMCVGSLLLPRVIPVRAHPLRVYALLEFGIGVIGLAVLLGMPLINQLYASFLGHGQTSILLRGLVSAICLLPPTLLMGATLPAIARWVESTPKGVAWLGFFYGGNIAGAVVGCLLAGFYLLRVYDMHIATYVAVALNFGVGGLALLIASPLTYRPADSAPPGTLLRGASWHVYLVIALSGMTALAAEVIWTRLLSLMLGATVYAFAIILAVFLTGLGIGSSGGAAVARNTSRPGLWLGVCQLLLAAAIVWAATAIASWLPYWPLDPRMTLAPKYVFQADIMRCLFSIFPAALLWGASFPLALAAVAPGRADTGRVVGGVYAANTVGAIVGSLAASLLLVQSAGTQLSQQLLIEVAAFSALLMFLPLLLDEARRGIGMLLIIATAGAAAGLALLVPPVPGLLVAYGRYLPTRRLVIEDNGEIHDRTCKIAFAGEGMNSSVAVTELPGGGHSFHVSGRIEASTEPQDMRLQRMLGHIPALAHPNPKSILVVGCGAGVTAGTFLTYPSVERVVICEIEPLIPQVVATYFKQQNYSVVNDPKRRVEIVYDDARHFILTTNEKFDIITSDPIHPWVKGSATLYTREYFELVRKHLKPGGVVTQWVPLYESSPAVVKSEIATFANVFPNGSVWNNTDINGSGYDVVLLGSDGEISINLDELDKRLSNTLAGESLREVGFATPLDLLATYAGSARDIRDWLADAEINSDRNLRLQFLAGMALNQFHAENIADSIVARRSFPEQMFTGSERKMQTLRLALSPRRTTQR